MFRMCGIPWARLTLRQNSWCSMPELPEVETTRRGIEPHVVGKRIKSIIVRQPSLRWPIPNDLSAHIINKKLLDVTRRGKYLLFRFSTGHLVIHLGMSGSLRIVGENETPKKHDHVDIIFSKHCCLRYHDPRRFGAVLWTSENIVEYKLLKNLGPEPLSDEFKADYLFIKSRKRSLDIKAFIMNSSIVVGVGNIYANEALFAAGIRPTKPAGKVTRKKYDLLVEEIKTVLERSILQGGTTLRDFVGSNGKPGYFVQELNVYGRAGLDCKNCNKTLKLIRQSQRATVYCTNCQV
jgi:formamidopyrimidine-DNA glycosylase